MDDMDIAEFDRRARAMPLDELKRLNNTMDYLHKFKPLGEELESVLKGLCPDAKKLMLDMLKEGVTGGNPYDKDQAP